MARATAALATLFVFFYSVHFGSSASMKRDLSRATNKSQELAHELKQDLRKNNDDYSDVRAAAAGLRNPYLGGGAPGPEPGDPGPGPAARPREPGNAPGPAPRTSAAERPPSAPAAAPHRLTGGSDGAMKAAPVSVPAPARRSNDKSPQLHRLLAQEGLLQKFLRGLPEAGKKRLLDWTAAPARGEGGGEMRPRVLDSSEFFRPTPDTIPEAELDMLAATGEHIATLKRRGRLCYRSILFPEGPKYDSRGKVYLQSHSLVANFAATRRPKLVLPRCCNCCKKSVLGCE